MKAKKILATGLALGILTSTASLYTDHEARNDEQTTSSS